MRHLDRSRFLRHGINNDSANELIASKRIFCVCAEISGIATGETL